jgi:predicted outer membrane repeat protein
MRTSLFVVAAALFSASASAQTTWHVDATAAGPGVGNAELPFPTIQDAIDQALPDDSVLVAPGTYIENLTGLGGRSLLSTHGPDLTIIDGAQSGSVIRSCGNEPTCNSQVGHVVIDGFTLTNGLANRGGGLFCSFGNLDVRNCILVGNSTPVFDGNGGAGVLARTNSSFTDCRFVDNFANGDGGAFRLEGEGSHTFLRCVFDSNTGGNGGAVETHEATGSIVAIFDRCTFANNHAVTHGGAIRKETSFGGGSVTITNCIVVGNTPDQLSGENITVRYSDVQDGWSTGPGNIDADPLFWSPSEGDYYLRPESPCIDSGDPAVFGDPDGSVLDMGAFRFDLTHGGCTPTTYCSAKSNSLDCPTTIGHSGTLSVSGTDDFNILATSVIANQHGILIWSADALEQPFMGGTLCVRPPIIRTPVQNSGGDVGCAGAYSFPFTHDYLGSHLLTAGNAIFAQYWYRDPGQVDGTGVGLTNAIVVVICP